MEAQKTFSIVIPVYNAEKYVKESIQSVIGQSCGFKKNVELILVNDGSADSSGSICEEYQQQYPDNVIYIQQENAGVSAARNAGIRAATGKIIGFLDADDKFSRLALANVDAYFRIALDTADVAVIPVENFGDKTFPYYLNGKFDCGTRTIELNEPSWNYPCMRVGQAFIRSEAAKSVDFDTSITFFEDTKYINQIAHKKMRIGLVTGCQYYYRRYPTEADSATSITVGAESNKRLYLETPVKVPLFFLETYQDDTDAPLYFQYLALCEMRWRTFYTQNSTRDFLSAEDFREYEQINDRILKRVSDRAIMTYGYYAPWQKLYLLKLKHKTDVLQGLRIGEDNKVYWNEYPLCDANKALFLLTNIACEDGSAKLTGYVNTILADHVSCFAVIDGQKRTVERSAQTIAPSSGSLSYDCYEDPVFTLKLPIGSDLTKVVFGLEADGKELLLQGVGFSKKGAITGDSSNCCIYSGLQFKCIGNGLEISKATPMSEVQLETAKLLSKNKQRLKKALAAWKKGPVFFLKKVKAKLFK